jgi:hypothetical protein
MEMNYDFGTFVTLAVAAIPPFLFSVDVVQLPLLASIVPLRFVQCYRTLDLQERRRDVQGARVAAVMYFGVVRRDVFCPVPPLYCARRSLILRVLSADDGPFDTSDSTKEHESVLHLIKTMISISLFLDCYAPGFFFVT